MKAVFAIPGDMHRKTGGFIYEARLLAALNEIGCTTRHLQVADSFPDPTKRDMQATIEALCAVPLDQPIILDGLVFGAIDPAGLAQVRAPIIAMVHHPLGLETGLDPERAKFLLANEAAALAVARHVIVPSPHTATILVEKFGVDRSDVTVALPGFPRPFVASAPQNPPLILSVGLLAARKGHDVLLAALAQVQDLHWTAEIIGKVHDQTVANALLAQRNALGLGSRVAFLNEVANETLNDRFNAASLFALATRYEGYGMVLSEAMHFGLPVVSCATGAVPDTVGHAGLLVPPDDADAFAAALRRVLTDKALHMKLSGRAREKAKRLPDWSDTAQIVAQVIAKMGKDMTKSP